MVPGPVASLRHLSLLPLEELEEYFRCWADGDSWWGGIFWDCLDGFCFPELPKKFASFIVGGAELTLAMAPVEAMGVVLRFSRLGLARRL